MGTEGSVILSLNEKCSEKQLEKLIGVLKEVNFIEKVTPVNKRSARRFINSGMQPGMQYYSSQIFGARIKKEKKEYSIDIHCVCGELFNFTKTKKPNPLDRCPGCEELYHFEDEFIEGHCSVIRPRTNQQLHFEKTEKELSP